MSTTIEAILATPDKKKEIQYNIITAMSKDIGRGYIDLKNAVAGGSKSQFSNKQQQGVWIIDAQITMKTEQREKKRLEKRKYNQ